jgi:hypothetical protein
MIELLEHVVAKQAQKPKKKAPVRKTIIKVAAPAAAPVAPPNPKAVDSKKSVESWWG